jgi:hypothetical protein
VPSKPRPHKGTYVELPPDLLGALDRRREKSGWTRKSEIVLALEHWLQQPVVSNPTKRKR